MGPCYDALGCGSGGVTIPSSSPPSAPSASSGGGEYNVNAAYGQSAGGIVAAPGSPGAQPAQAAATNIIPGVGIPNWVYYVAGGLVLVGVIFLVTRRVKRSGFRGLDHFDEDEEGEESEDEDELGE